MDKDGAIGAIIGKAEELGSLFFFGVTIDDGDIEVLESELLCQRLFFIGAVLTRSAEVDDGLDAGLFECLELFGSWLAASAEFLINFEEVPDGLSLLLARNGNRADNDYHQRGQRQTALCSLHCALRSCQATSIFCECVIRRTYRLIKIRVYWRGR